MDFHQVKKKIQQGEIVPVYVFYGEEKLQIEDVLNEIRRQALSEDTLDFNYERFDLREQPIQAAVEAAETYPFLGEKRMVVAAPADFLTAAKSKSAVEHDLTSLEQFIQNPVPYAVFVLLSDGAKLDERKKIVKLLKKHAVVVSSSPLKEEQLIPWIREQAGAQGVEIEEEAIGLLLQFVGTNMRMLDGEIRKMAQFVGQNRQINVQVVLEMVSKTVEHNVFKLVDQAAQLKMDQAFETLYELLKRNEEPIKILFLLARQFRLIYRAKLLSKQGYSRKQLSQILKVHPYVCQLAVQQGRNFSEDQLARFLNLLAELDYEIKTGQMEKKLALEMFLLRLGRQKTTRTEKQG